MATYKPRLNKYTLPKNRVVEPISSLSPDNFPEFGSATPSPRSPLNFKQQILTAEEQRKKADDPSNYDSTKIRMMKREQLEKDGWAVLSLPKGGRGGAYISGFDISTPEKFEIDLFMESLEKPLAPSGLVYDYETD